MPYAGRRFLGHTLGWIWFDVLRIRRNVIIDNMGIAFPNLSRQERIGLGRQAMKEFGQNIVEHSLLPFLTTDNFTEHFVFHGREHLDRALAKGRGVLLLTLHLGNGDLAVAGLALCGYPMYLVSKIFKSKWLNDLWFGMRERSGVRFIPPRNSSYSVLKALKNKGVVIFVLDQFTGPPIGIRTRFFGRETGTGVGLATIAERSQAPVVPAYTVRNAKGQFEVFLEPEIAFEIYGDRDETLARMTQSYNDRLERYVRMYPTQWMWLHKRWKKFKY